MYRLARIPRSHDQKPIDDIAQLPHIARPAVGLQRGQRVFAELAWRNARRLGAALHEMARELRNVFAPLAQRRHADRHDAQAIEQILAEATGGDLARQLAIGRSDDADIDLDPVRSPYPLEGLLL